jgi:hypothetical protein
MMKNYICWIHFDDVCQISTAQQVADAQVVACSQIKSFIESWIDGGRKCISYKGEYFERILMVGLNCLHAQVR